MKRRIVFLLPLYFLLLGLLGSCSDVSATGPSGSSAAALIKAYPDLKGHKYETFKVKRVVDGDTFETDSKQKIRLIGVDTPETVKRGSPVEAYGKEASDYTKKRLVGQTVIAFADAEDKDRYGRLLRYIFIEGETRMYNEELVAEGYANIMTVPPNVMYAKSFLKLEREARERKKGLWADPKPAGTKK